MKKNVTLILLLTATCLGVFAQGNWYPKKDFAGAARYYAAGFSIGTKGYIGTGTTVAGDVNDFWQWDPATNIWTQIASYLEPQMTYCFGFSLGNKGYVVGGHNGVIATKFVYEYDPSINTWAKKADYSKFVLVGFGFGIDNLAYFGGGNTGTVALDDFWAFDPTTNTWSQKANYGGGKRYFAVSFTMSGKGYVGTGAGETTPVNDFWEYDPTTNTWTKKANFAGAARYAAAGFSIGNKAWIGGGMDATYQYYDWYEYDLNTNKWSPAASFKAGPRYNAVAFSIGNYGYCGTGAFKVAPNTYVTSDFWEFNPAAPGFYEHPMDTMVCAGDSVILSVLGWGGSVQYKWQRNGTDVSAYSNDTFLILYPVKAGDHGYYTCIIKNAVTTDTSFEAYVNVSAGPASVILQPKPLIGCLNFKDTLWIQGQSHSPMTYKWYKNGVEVLDATDSFLSVYNVKAKDTGYYYCVITNLCGERKTDSVKVSLYPDPPAPTITQAWSQLTCNPEAVGYQWKKYNVNIPGAMYRTHIITEKAKYSVEITDNNGCRKVSAEGLFTPSGLNEIAGEKPVQVYPNPSEGKFFVELSTNEPLSLKVVNLLGESVYELNNLQGQNIIREVDLTSAGAGSYYIIIKGEEIYYTEKIFIRK